MSVLIKGMRMPENCGKCPFLIEEDIDFDICRQCGAGKNGYIYEEDIDGFPADCPLVDLGKHGDLKEFIEVPEYIDDDDGTYGIKASDIFKAYMDMKFAPTVIEAEDGT